MGTMAHCCINSFVLQKLDRRKLDRRKPFFVTFLLPLETNTSPDPKIHRRPKYQIRSAVELVSRKLFIVRVLLPLTVAKSQIGEAAFTLQLLLLWKMTSRRCLAFWRDLGSLSSAGFLPSLLLHLSLLSPPLCGVEAGNSVVHRGNHEILFTRALEQCLTFPRLCSSVPGKTPV